MHINLDKRPDYFFLERYFSGGAQWEPRGCTKKKVGAPNWTEPPVRPWYRSELLSELLSAKKLLLGFSIFLFLLNFYFSKWKYFHTERNPNRPNSGSKWPNKGGRFFFSHLNYFWMKCIFSCFLCFIIHNAKEYMDFYPFLTPEIKKTDPTIFFSFFLCEK